MDWKVLKSEEVYQKAVKRALALFHYESGTEAEELELLLVLIKDYEDKHISIPSLDPVEVIKLKMKEQGLKNKDLEPIIGSKGHVSSVLSGRRELTLAMAQRLKEFFNLPSDVFFQKM
jgi:HTH-type transcriptional regulator/antitoxin HigA